jgi:hypothetical protein
VDTRRWLTKEQKVEVVKQIMDCVKSGMSFTKASRAIHNASFKVIQRWADSDKDIWEMIYDKPYPYVVRVQVSATHYERKVDTAPVLPWAVAAQHLREGKTVRHHESMLYRYRMDGGRLIEIRRCLETGSWYEVDDLSVPLEAFLRWKYQVVE